MQKNLLKPKSMSFLVKAPRNGGYTRNGDVFPQKHQDTTMKHTNAHQDLPESNLERLFMSHTRWIWPIRRNATSKPTSEFTIEKDGICQERKRQLICPTPNRWSWDDAHLPWAAMGCHGIQAFARLCQGTRSRCLWNRRGNFQASDVLEPLSGKKNIRVPQP